MIKSFVSVTAATAPWSHMLKLALQGRGVPTCPEGLWLPACVADGHEWTATLRPPFKFEKLRSSNKSAEVSSLELAAVRSMAGSSGNREAAAALSRGVICLAVWQTAPSAISLKPKCQGCLTDEGSGESVCPLT